VYQLRQGRALLPPEAIEWRTSGIRKAGKLLEVDKITPQRGGLQSFGLDDQRHGRTAAAALMRSRPREPPCAATRWKSERAARPLGDP
jgi:hypothetical protein